MVGSNICLCGLILNFKVYHLRGYRFCGERDGCIGSVRTSI